MQRAPGMFLILAAAERRQLLARAVIENRMRAGHSALVAPRRPANLPVSVECVLVPETVDDIAAAGATANGVIIATLELAAAAGAHRSEHGVAVVLLGHSDSRRPGQLTSIARRRLEAAKRIALERAHDLRAVVLSGRGPDDQAPEADQYAHDWQGERLPLLREIASMTTRENADEAAKLLVALGGVEEVIVVTSRWHRARALWVMNEASRRVGATWTLRCHSTWRPLPTPARLLRERHYFANDRSA